MLKPLIKTAIYGSIRLYSNNVRKTLPQPKGLPLVGTMLDLLAAGGGPKLHLYIDSRHKQLGPIFSDTIGPVKATFIADPKDMRQVFAAEGKFPIHLVPEAWVLYNKLYGSERGLFFMNGEEWFGYRHIMNKIMFKLEPSHGLVSSYMTATTELVNNWENYIDKPVENLVNHLHKLSISYVIAALLGSSYPDYKDHLKPEVELLSATVYLIFQESTKLNLVPAHLAATLGLPAWRRFVSAVDTSLFTANKLVTQLLPVASSDGILYQMSAEDIPYKKIVSIVIDLILAAGDTTPYTLIWALYMLGRNHSIQSKVAQGVSRTTAQEQLSHHFLRAVIRETLRLYPAAPFLTRVLASDTLLSGYTVPAGEMIVMSLYTSGRCNDYFPDALKFSPERWLRDDKGYQGVIEASASLPFAVGGRACIGRRLAEAELSLSLANILLRFQIDVKKDIEMKLMLVPVPAEPVILYLSKRSPY